MSVLEDLTPPRDGGPLVVNDLNDSGPPPVGPQPGPQSGPGAPPSQYGGKGPFPATVEDYPDEDDALARNTSPRPAAATADIPTTSPTTPQKDIDAREPNEHYAPVTHDSPLPPFIQLQGLPPPEHPQPEAFRYLDADSPVVTPGAIRRSVASSSGTNGPHPISPSVLGHSSVPSSHLSDVFSQATRNSESHCSWGPEHVVPQRGPDLPFAAQLGHESPANYGLHEPHSMSTGFSHGGPAWHTSPEMAYGNINTTPFTSHATPAVQSPYFSQPPLHPQKPALTGYQHLALKLAGTVFGFPSVTPIYRRFEALNHRLLLQLQDEIVELEQQLDSIDAADTSSRAMPMGFIPASRRGENMAQGELGWQKQEILSKIGWKLSQYSKIISSFKETQYLPTPTLKEIQDYRGFLFQGGTIAEPETRFLDDPNDLISLAAADRDESPQEVQNVAGDSTPTPQSSSVFGSPPAKPKSTVETTKTPQRPAAPHRRSPIYLAYAAIIAVLVPVLTFVVIPGFLERMVIVMLVFSGVAMAVVQSGLLAGMPERRVTDCIVCAGLYGGLMAVVGGVFA